MTDTVGLLQAARAGDKTARDQVIRDNLGLVRHSAKRFLNRGYDMEELMQIGCIGLMKAVDRFDDCFGVCFSTYAVPMIQGEIRRFLRDDGMIKVTRSIKENQWKVMQADSALTEELGRSPTLSELAGKTGLSTEEILDATNASMEVESIYRPMYRSEEGEIELIDQLRAESDEQSIVVNRLAVTELLDKLEEREKKMILLRYYRNRTQSETAKALGMTQVQVSRLEKRVLQNMRSTLEG